MESTVANPEIRFLADQLERSFHGGAWHGPAILEALEDVDATRATRRPPGSTHTILELVGHLTFWLDAVRRCITGGCDVPPEGDWPPPADTVTGSAWADATARLEEAHAGLCAVVSKLDDGRLDDAVPGADPTVRALLLGTLQHNAYHTGQIVHIARELAREPVP